MNAGGENVLQKTGGYETIGIRSQYGRAKNIWNYKNDLYVSEPFSLSCDYQVKLQI